LQKWELFLCVSISLTWTLYKFMFVLSTGLLTMITTFCTNLRPFLKTQLWFSHVRARFWGSLGLASKCLLFTLSLSMLVSMIALCHFQHTVITMHPCQ
jgi:hypothetical protein